MIISDESGCTLEKFINLIVEDGFEDIKINVTHSTCDLANGNIKINYDLDERYRFSLNGLTYQRNNTFNDLASGGYTISTRR